MRPISSTTTTLAVLIVGVLVTSAQAFPSAGPALETGWRHALRGFGVIDPGSCVLVRRDVIDVSNRVRVRLVRVCD